MARFDIEYIMIPASLYMPILDFGDWRAGEREDEHYKAVRSPVLLKQLQSYHRQEETIPIPKFINKIF